MEQSQNALAQGRQLYIQLSKLSIFEGRLAELLHFRCCQLREEIEDVLQNSFAFDVVKFKK